MNESEKAIQRLIAAHISILNTLGNSKPEMFDRERYEMELHGMMKCLAAVKNDRTKRYHIDTVITTESKQTYITYSLKCRNLYEKETVVNCPIH